MKARLVKLEKQLEKPLSTRTNLRFAKNKNGEVYLAILNPIQIKRIPEQTEKDFVDMAQTIATQ